MRDHVDIQGYDPKPIARMHGEPYSTGAQPLNDLHLEAERLTVRACPGINEVVLQLGKTAVRIDAFAVIEAIHEMVGTARAVSRPLR